MRNAQYISIILLPILIGSAVQADTFYFTRGPEGADSYTRNWSDAQNWDTDGTHIYDGEEVRRLAQRVIDRYIPAFERMRHAIDARYADVLDEL